MFRIILVLFLLSILASCNSKTPVKNHSISSVDRLMVEEMSDLLDGVPKDSLIRRMRLVQNHFINFPYLAGTLDEDTVERVVLNLQGFDCVTFVETVLALANEGDGSDAIDRFAQNIEMQRYRDGVCKGYISRLHYFSEWLKVNEQRQHLMEIRLDEFGIEFRPRVNFMSTHVDLYKGLSEYPERVDSVREYENSIHKLNLMMIPQSRIEIASPFINESDVIGIVTNIEGLDISHTGFAYHKNGHVHFLHASSEKKQVVISEKTLHDYIYGIQHMVGIVIFRPLPF